MQHTTTNIDEMPREQVRAIIARHRGAVKEIAVSVSRSSCTVSMVLRGECTSAHVLAAARAKAKELLALERKRLEEVA